MRISERQRYDITSSRVEQAKSDNAKMLELVSSQKRINELSDDPIGAGQAIKHRSRLADIRQYIKNIDYSKGYIERTESAIMGIHDYLIRAKELAVSLSNSTYGAESREAAAREVKEIIDGVVSLANTSYGNRYVFGGFRTQTPPVSRDGQFLGDDGAIYLQIGEGSFRQINIQARGLFEAGEEERAKGHFDMINTLSILYDGLRTDDVDMVRKSLDELDFHMDRSSSYQATLGAIYNAVDTAKQRLELDEELSQGELSKVEDTDMYRAASDFKRTETVLQSTLQASNKLLQPSLLNFMQ